MKRLRSCVRVARVSFFVCVFYVQYAPVKTAIAFFIGNIQNIIFWFRKRGRARSTPMIDASWLVYRLLASWLTLRNVLFHT